MEIKLSTGHFLKNCGLSTTVCRHPQRTATTFKSLIAQIPVGIAQKILSKVYSIGYNNLKKPTFLLLCVKTRALHSTGTPRHKYMPWRCDTSNSYLQLAEATRGSKLQISLKGSTTLHPVKVKLAIASLTIASFSNG